MNYYKTFYELFYQLKNPPPGLELNEDLGVFSAFRSQGIDSTDTSWLMLKPDSEPNGADFQKALDFYREPKIYTKLTVKIPTSLGGNFFLTRGCEPHYETRFVYLDVKSYQPDEIDAAYPYTIRETTSSDEICQGLQAGFSFSREVAEKFDQLFYSHPDYKTKNYVALDGDKIIGMANINFLKSDPRVASLSGSGVAPEYRKKGTYKRFLQERLKVAKELNLEVVCVEARSNTSYPSLIKRGFQDSGQAARLLVLNL